MSTGSCLCGHIKYTIDVDPTTTTSKTSACHCRACRKITGATTSLNLIVPASTFHLTPPSGELKIIKVPHIDEPFDFSLAFCPECGSPIYAVPHWEGLGDIVVIQVGTLDDEGWVEKTPGQESNVWKRVGWFKGVEGAEVKERYT
jgi:hypothetical protein